MQTGQKVLAVFFSVLLAIGTFLYLDASGVSTDIRHYFFGNSAALETFSQYAGASYWERLKAVMLLLFIFFVLYSFIFLLFFEALAVLYFLLSSKWRKPCVFISYKNSEAGAVTNTTMMAGEIRSQLESKAFRTLFFEYSTAMHHDEVNFRIQENLRKCQAMVVVPDPQHPSYVNTEIQGAVLSYKPVYLIRYKDDQELPDTANSGHTVFIWDKLKESKFSALLYLLRYVHNYWTTRFFILSTPLFSFFIPFSLLDENENTFIKSLIVFALVVAGLIYINVSLPGLLLCLELITTLVAAAGAYLTISAILERSRLQNAARQSVLNGGSAYMAFKDAGIAEDILNCLDKNGLAIKQTAP
jgi:hypothetical protein